MQSARTTAQSAEGGIEVTERVETAQRVTAQFEYAHTNFGNGPKAAVTQQVLVPIDADEEVIAEETKIALQNCRARVFEALDIPFELVDGVVVPSIPEIVEKAKSTFKPKAAAAPRGPSKEEFVGDIADQKAAAWADLARNPDHWFNNVGDKQSAKSPDFKGKRTSGAFDGFGLWLDDRKGGTPQWAIDKFGA